jgi:catechol 2,3-dioxygenase-like lactoylglutathione lyase family enzyme
LHISADGVTVEAATTIDPRSRGDAAMSGFRYIVDDVDAAIAFYERLGFETAMHPAPEFAMLRRDDLHLFLNAPRGAGGAAQPASDGRRPAPGGWNRIQLDVDDLDATVDRLAGQGVPFRSDIITGIGGRQILADDPSGNPVELFEPKR